MRWMNLPLAQNINELYDYILISNSKKKKKTLLFSLSGHR